MKNKVQVILNEQHKLKQEQKEILNKRFGENWELYPVPSSGWTKEQQDKKIHELELMNTDIVFASPVPYMMKELAYDLSGGESMRYREIYVFHNDNREKKELPNGKVIFTVSETGWQLI